MVFRTAWVGFVMIVAVAFFVGVAVYDLVRWLLWRFGRRQQAPPETLEGRFYQEAYQEWERRCVGGP